MNKLLSWDLAIFLNSLRCILDFKFWDAPSLTFPTHLGNTKSLIFIWAWSLIFFSETVVMMISQFFMFQVPHTWIIVAQVMSFGEWLSIIARSELSSDLDCYELKQEKGKMAMLKNTIYMILLCIIDYIGTYTFNLKLKLHILSLYFDLIVWENSHGVNFCATWGNTACVLWILRSPYLLNACCVFPYRTEMNTACISGDAVTKMLMHCISE